jgi:WD domain, G-beta repeat/Anaphase-promoting complex subunit 4 WD40 domain
MSGSDVGEPVADFEAALAEFKADLRALYLAYGSPPYRKVLSLLASRGHRVSLAWVTAAFQGDNLPSEDHTIAFVLLLTSKPETADPEAEDRWRRRWKNLERMKLAARAASRNNPTRANDDTVAELTELRTLRVSQEARINELVNQVTDLIEQVEGLTEKQAEAKALVSNLRQALYARWPTDGVPLKYARWPTDGVPLKGAFGVSSIAFRPDGSVLAVGYRSGLLRTWDPDSGEYIKEAAASHDSPVHCVAYSDDGDILVTGGGDGTVRLAHPRSCRPLGDDLLTLSHAVRAAAFSPAREQGRAEWRYSLAVGDREGTVHVWTFADMPQGDAAFTFLVDGPVQSLAFVPGHDALAVATEFGRVTVHRLDESGAREGAAVFSDAENAAVRSLAFDSVTGVLVVGDEVGRVHLITLCAGDPLRVEQRAAFSVGFPVRSVASCPGSPLLAIAGPSGVVLRESSAGASTGPSIEGEVRSVAFRPDGKLIAVGLVDGSTQLHLVAHARSQGPPDASADGKPWWRR